MCIFSISASTIVPVDADEMAFQMIYESLFSLNTTESELQSALFGLYIKLGGNASQVNQFVHQCKSLSVVLKPNPTASESLTIIEEINKFILSFETTIKSQIGLESFQTDTDLKNDVEFSEFYKSYASIFLELNGLKDNPSSAFEYFTTKIKTKYARFSLETIKSSKKAAIKKGIISELYFVVAFAL
jgi:hypothetical protein